MSGHSDSQGQEDDDSDSHEDYHLNRKKTTLEIQVALRKLNDRKAEGIDGIPAEVFKDNNLLAVLEVLFNQCFNAGKIPELWKSGIITPCSNHQQQTNVVRQITVM